MYIPSVGLRVTVHAYEQYRGCITLTVLLMLLMICTSISF